MQNESLIDINHESLLDRQDYYGNKYRGFLYAGKNMDEEHLKDSIDSAKLNLEEAAMKYNRLAAIHAGLVQALKEKSNDKMD